MDNSLISKFIEIMKKRDDSEIPISSCFYSTFKENNIINSYSIKNISKNKIEIYKNKVLYKTVNYDVSIAFAKTNNKIDHINVLSNTNKKLNNKTLSKLIKNYENYDCELFLQNDIDILTTNYFPSIKIIKNFEFPVNEITTINYIDEPFLRLLNLRKEFIIINNTVIKKIIL